MSAQPKRRNKTEIQEEKMRALEPFLKDSDEGLGLEVRKKGAVAGRGVFATKPYEIGETICRYKGERISWEAGCAMEQVPLKAGQQPYVLFVDGDKKSRFCIDASAEPKGVAYGRLINHAIEKEANAVSKGRKVGGTLYSFIEAKKKISIDEEIRYNYGESRREVLVKHPWLKGKADSSSRSDESSKDGSSSEEETQDDTATSHVMRNDEEAVAKKSQATSQIELLASFLAPPADLASFGVGIANGEAGLQESIVFENVSGSESLVAGDLSDEQTAAETAKTALAAVEIKLPEIHPNSEEFTASSAYVQELSNANLLSAFPTEKTATESLSIAQQNEIINGVSGANSLAEEMQPLFNPERILASPDSTKYQDVLLSFAATPRSAESSPAKIPPAQPSLLCSMQHQTDQHGQARQGTSTREPTPANAAAESDENDPAHIRLLHEILKSLCIGWYATELNKLHRCTIFCTLYNQEPSLPDLRKSVEELLEALVPGCRALNILSQLQATGSFEIRSDGNILTLIQQLDHFRSVCRQSRLQELQGRYCSTCYALFTEPVAMEDHEEYCTNKSKQLPPPKYSIPLMAFPSIVLEQTDRFQDAFDDLAPEEKQGIREFIDSILQEIDRGTHQEEAALVIVNYCRRFITVPRAAPFSDVVLFLHFALSARNDELACHRSAMTKRLAPICRRLSDLMFQLAFNWNWQPCLSHDDNATWNEEWQDFCLIDSFFDVGSTVMVMDNFAGPWTRARIAASPNGSYCQWNGIDKCYFVELGGRHKWVASVLPDDPKLFSAVSKLDTSGFKILDKVVFGRRFRSVPDEGAHTGTTLPTARSPPLAAGEAASPGNPVKSTRKPKPPCTVKKLTKQPDSVIEMETADAFDSSVKSKPPRRIVEAYRGFSNSVGESLKIKIEKAPKSKRVKPTFRKVVAIADVASTLSPAGSCPSSPTLATAKTQVALRASKRKRGASLIAGDLKVAESQVSVQTGPSVQLTSAKDKSKRNLSSRAVVKESALASDLVKETESDEALDDSHSRSRRRKDALPENGRQSKAPAAVAHISTCAPAKIPLNSSPPAMVIKKEASHLPKRMLGTKPFSGELKKGRKQSHSEDPDYSPVETNISRRKKSVPLIASTSARSNTKKTPLRVAIKKRSCLSERKRKSSPGCTSDAPSSSTEARKETQTKTRNTKSEYIQDPLLRAKSQYKLIKGLRNIILPRLDDYEIPFAVVVEMQNGKKLKLGNIDICDKIIDEDPSWLRDAKALCPSNKVTGRYL